MLFTPYVETCPQIVDSVEKTFYFLIIRFSTIVKDLYLKKLLHLEGFFPSETNLQRDF